MSNFWKSLDRNEVTYWVGLAMLFAGLTLSVSMATALVVTGAILISVGILNSLVMVWLAGKDIST